MDVNYITVKDVEDAKEQGRMVQIKCKNCQKTIGNHLSIIADYIKSGLPLHNCNCGAKTEIDQKSLTNIRIAGL